MKKNFFLLNISILFLFSILTINCSKSDRQDFDDVTPAIDNAEAQNVFDGIWKEITQLIDSASYTRSSCPTITFSTTNPSVWPKIITIDYGTTNCVGKDGNNRRGKLVATLSKPFHDSLSSIFINLNNFIHNDQIVEGTIIANNKGRINSNAITFTFVVPSTALIKTTIGNIVWSANQTKEWVGGQSTTNNPNDDIFWTRGTSSGISLNGNAFTSTIDDENPLQSTLTCTWTGSGSLKVYPKNYPLIYLDYGNNTCDHVATAIINKKATEIGLL